MNEKQIMQAVYKHHQIMTEQGYDVVMTVLIGSQNYKLDTDISDIDTFSFVMPSMKDLSSCCEPIRGEVIVEDGKCMYKDIRLALNLLKKTSPNSIECFIGQYRFYNPKYAAILSKYLDNDAIMNKMVHCNYIHMLYAMAGMAHQLTKRNMPAGKRYSHALRLLSMADAYTAGVDYTFLLRLSSRDYNEAMKAKRDNKELDYYNSGCHLIAEKLDKLHDTFIVSDAMKAVEQEGINLIDNLQHDLMLKCMENLIQEELK